jgi:hypothetical protein
MAASSPLSPASGAPLSAPRFWELRRLIYNLVLTAVALFWFMTAWSHYRTAVNWSAFGALLVLALLANVCYSAAYLAEIPIQQLAPRELWNRLRRALWIVGTVFAVLLESYWINDEIYPGVGQPAPDPIREMNAMWTPDIASNINFPAPLAVLGFLGAVIGLFLALGAAAIFLFARKPRLARRAALAIAAGAVVYLALLLGFSAASRTTTLARGQEKYFCEIDCHLAYSVVDVKTPSDGHYVITLRTRFDETTISPSRPKDAPLTPSPRQVRLVDSAGREYRPVSIEGTPLLTPLRPADSYTTQLEFDVPKGATGLRLLLNTTPGWPDHVVIGDENSWLHKKTYFSL